MAKKTKQRKDATNEAFYNNAPIEDDPEIETMPDYSVYGFILILAVMLFGILSGDFTETWQNGATL